MSDIYREIIEKHNASIEANNLDEFLSFFMDDVQWTKVGDKSAKGKDDLRRVIEGLGDAPPPSTVKFDGMIVEGDSVAAYGNLKIEIQPGVIITQDFCDIYRFRGNKIAELLAFIITPKAESGENTGA